VTVKQHSIRGRT